MKKGKFLILGMLAVGLILPGCNNGGSDGGNDQHGVGNNNSTYAAGAFLVKSKDYNPIYGNGSSIPDSFKGKNYYVPVTSRAEVQNLISSDTITNQYDGAKKTGLSFSEVKEALENNKWWWNGGSPVPNHDYFKNSFSGDATAILNELQTKGYVAVASNKVKIHSGDYIFLFYAFKE
jgi:hypothetical protein